MGEIVPASEKVVSIFEPHTDIIKKDRRYTFYGYKFCLTGGASKNNLNEAKSRKIKDVCFAKNVDLKKPICAAASMFIIVFETSEQEFNPAHLG